jgi:hypothetical protein
LTVPIPALKGEAFGCKRDKEIVVIFAAFD